MKQNNVEMLKVFFRRRFANNINCFIRTQIQSLHKFHQCIAALQFNNGVRIKNTVAANAVTSVSLATYFRNITTNISLLYIRKDNVLCSE